MLTNTARIEFDTLSKLCEALGVEAGDILKYAPDDDNTNKA